MDKEEENQTKKRIEETMYQEVKKIVTIKRKKKIRLRAIFLHFRAMVKYRYISTLATMTVIVEALIDLKLPYSDDEIYSTFKLVEKDDYHSGQKKELLGGFLRCAKDKSVF